MREVDLGRGMRALVDDADYEKVMAYSKWHAETKPGRPSYAYTTVKLDQSVSWGVRGNTRRVQMHRVIYVRPLKAHDHINGDGLDNRRVNLRHATTTYNNWNQRFKKNKSGVPGAHYHSTMGRWSASIRVGSGRRINLGYFGSPEEASAAYLRAKEAYHGEWCRLQELDVTRRDVVMTRVVKIRERLGALMADEGALSGKDENSTKSALLELNEMACEALLLLRDTTQAPRHKEPEA